MSGIDVVFIIAIAVLVPIVLSIVEEARKLEKDLEELRRKNNPH